MKPGDNRISRKTLKNRFSQRKNHRSGFVIQTSSRDRTVCFFQDKTYSLKNLCALCASARTCRIRFRLRFMKPGDNRILHKDPENRAFSAIAASVPCWCASPVNPHVCIYTPVLRAVLPCSYCHGRHVCGLCRSKSLPRKNHYFRDPYAKS